MRIEQVQIQQFRQIEEAGVSLSPNWNLIYGSNAQGKTSFLEALYYLSFAKSFKTSREQHMITFDHDYVRVAGTVQKSSESTDLVIYCDKKQKKLQVNGHNISRLSDYIGHIQMILFSPDESSLIKGAPKERRKFIDRLFSQIDPEYLLIWQDYMRIVKDKNAVLKQYEITPDKTLLMTYQQTFYKHALALYKKRLQFMEQFIPMIKEKFSQVFQNHEVVSMKYISRCPLKDVDMKEMAVCGEKYLAKEIATGSCCWGPHQDDIIFYLDHKDAKFFASQGQIKSLILAIKLASIDLLKVSTGELPVFLIDDISSEWDEYRLECFFQSMPQMQVVMTSTQYQSYPFDSGKVMTMQSGQMVDEE